MSIRFSPEMDDSTNAFAHIPLFIGARVKAVFSIEPAQGPATIPQSLAAI
jgi:hypothetical protein